MSNKVNLSSPLPVRFFAWISERFPVANWFLFFILFVSAFLFGRFLSGDDALTVSAWDLLGFVACWCFFLMLRIFDEHKDYEIDCALHPERVLQKGLIRLSHLKVAGVIAIALQLAVSIWFDRGLGLVTMFWLVVMAWSLLMAKEFFIGEWLKPRLVLYAVSHMLVTPMMLAWLAQMGMGQQLLPLQVIWVGVLMFFSGFTFEITRKTWGPEEEREGMDSYAKIFGVSHAPVVVMVLLLAAVAVQVKLLFIILGAPSWFWYLLLVATLAFPFWSLMKFRSAPSAAGRKLNEAAVGLAMLASNVIMVAAMIAQRGIVWL